MKPKLYSRQVSGKVYSRSILTILNQLGAHVTSKEKATLRKQLQQQIEETAKSHQAADKACGRKWECACGACNIARKGGAK
jgi:hypothetical protein